MRNFSKDVHIWLLIIGVHILSVNILSRYSLTYYPNTGDEFALYFQADIFSNFQLTADAPPVANIFDTHYVDIKNGKWFGQYPPVYSLMILPGLWIGSPIVWVSFLSGLTIFLLCSLLKHIFGDEYRSEIILFCLIFSLSPTFLFHAASYYSHIGALLIFTLILYNFFTYLKNQKLKNVFFVSLLFGLGVGVRPFTFFLLSIPFFIEIIRRKLQLKAINLVAVFLPFISVLCLLLLYNFNQMGQWDEISYLNAGNNFSKLSLSHLNLNSLDRVIGMLGETSKWLFGVGIFQSGDLKNPILGDINLGVILLCLSLGYLLTEIFHNRATQDHKTSFKFIAFFSILIIVLGHIFYNFRGGRFGERFFFEITWMILFSFLLVLKEVKEVIRHRKIKKIFYSIVILFFIPSIFIYTPVTAKKLRESNLRRMDIFLKTSSLEFKEAVVHIVSSPDFDVTFYARNTPNLSGTIFVAYDDRFFHDIYLRYEDRKHYVYMFNEKENTGNLIPLSR